jgi:hypothetical protein
MNRILVGIIMGSESDLSIMKNASDVLLQFEIEHEIRIVSAHRTVHEMISYGESAIKKRFRGHNSRSRRCSSPPGYDCFIDAIAGHRCPH